MNALENIVTKQILVAYAILALIELSRKFNIVTVHLAKSADLATN
jgi:hypothetical protein